MKLFGWMQSKLSARQGTNNTRVVSAPDVMGFKKEPPEERGDWPSGLLAIGTFGNADPDEKNQETGQPNVAENPFSSVDLLDFTPEKVGKLQKELTKLLSRKAPAATKARDEIAGLPLDRFLICPSSMEVDRRISNSHCGDPEKWDIHDDIDIEKAISDIMGKCRELCDDKKKNRGIGKKSMSFLIKNMFVCRSGFAPAPSLRDTLQESRMEKRLRMLLQKKMYAQNPSRASSIKRYLEDKPKERPHREDDDIDDDGGDYGHERTKDKGKWVKTDSECE